MDHSLLGFSVHGISQAGLLEWVAISFPGDLPEPGIKSASPTWQTYPLPLLLLLLLLSRFSHVQLCDPKKGSPPGSRRPWDSPGKNTGVGCHFLLQCMKVKSESEVAQLCPTLNDPMDCSLPGSSTHGIFQARVLEWGAIAFSTFTTEPPGKPIETIFMPYFHRMEFGTG